jgi:uncharacterized protein involved in outer membrane biogenesis
MAIIQPAIERKLSALLGVPIKFEKLSVSLLGGSIEATGVTAGDFLTIAKVRADVAVTRALKGEIVVKSLTIERPEVVIKPRAKRVANEVENERKPAARDNDDDDGDRTRWRFDVEKLLLLDGSIELRLENYELASPRVLVQLTRQGDGYSVTLLAERVARQDRQMDVGEVGITGRIDGASDLLAIADAAASLEIRIGDLATIHYDTPRVRALRGDVKFSGAFELSRLLDLLPLSR